MLTQNLKNQGLIAFHSPKLSHFSNYPVSYNLTLDYLNLPKLSNLCPLLAFNRIMAVKGPIIVLNYFPRFMTRKAIMVCI